MLGIRFYASLIIIGLLTAGIWHYKHTLAENARLNRELKTANSTVSALDETARRNNELYEVERMAVDEIESAPDVDDGPVAPVLLRTLNGLQRESQ